MLDERRRFLCQEMVKRGWVKGRGNVRDFAEEMYSELAGPAGGPNVLAGDRPRKNDERRISAKTNFYALWAWCWRVVGTATENAPQVAFKPGTMDMEFMHKVAQCSEQEDGPLAARNCLAERGIALVVERHLPRTCQDGAALRLDSGLAVIGLKLGDDRIDNFWFTLMHELAHVRLHLDGGEERVFFDDHDLKESIPIEEEADELAEDALIPRDVWETSAAAENPSPMAVYDLSRKAEVHMAAGRVRYENKDYRLLSQFVGKGEVRRLFGRE